jgi:hypothetical protein
MNPINKWSCPNCLKTIFPYYPIEDNQTLSIILNNDNNIELDLAALESMVFDPLDNAIGDGTGVLDDIDPDNNYLNELRGNQIQNCQFYFNDSNIPNIKEKIQCIDLSLFHLNIRSMPKNFDKLIPLLTQSLLKYSIIALTESWLKPQNADVYNLPDYSHEYITRTSRNGGGISLFIKDNITYKLREDLTHIDESLEMIWIEIEKDSINSTANLLFGTIYRVPGTDPTHFNTKLNEVLTIVDRENKQCTHVGYYNLNLLNSSNHIPTNEFADINFSHTLYPSINKPTRITDQSATLIDNIFVNNQDLADSISGILLSDISDHLPVFFIKFGKEKITETPFRTSRSFNIKNKQTFTTKINEVDWSPILENNDTQSSYTLFHDKVTQIFNQSFPKTTKKVGYLNRLPWLSTGLKNSIRHKHRLSKRPRPRFTACRSALHHHLHGGLVRGGGKPTW